MLERLKEKKQSVTDAIGAALDAVFMSTSLGDIEADVLEALKSKNPQVKEHSAKFLTRCLKTTKEAPSLEQTKEIAEASKKLLTESVATLRDEGAEILGVLWKIMGDRNMLSHLEGLDDIRKTKIKEFSDAAEVKAKWKPKAAAPPPKAAGAGPGKKPALGAKKAPAGAAKKVAAPRAASPPIDEDAGLQPRPTSRPSVKAPGAVGGLKPPGTGLKPPSGLAKPGTGLKAPSSGPSSGTASPKRQGMMLEEAPLAPKPGVAAPGRGLAGRPLGKPSAPSSPPRQQDISQPSALSSVERQELSELRASVELLQQQNSDLRNDKLRMTSQVTELQNTNAQLIEDHTRDVLQIKAKETQLVRARSDAESAEDRANSLSKEIDRLKRELNRLGRGRAPSDAPLDSPSMNMNGELMNGAPPASSIRPAYGISKSYNVPSARAYGVDSFGASGEGKENIPDETAAEYSKLSGASVPAYSRPLSHGSSGGRATPASADDINGASVANGPNGTLHGRDNSTSGGSISSGSLQRNSVSGDGVESWRRAAEVTQNLKARIEMMKVRLLS